MVMAVAAAEATVGLAIVIAIYRNKQTPLVDEYDAMQRVTDGAWRRSSRSLLVLPMAGFAAHGARRAAAGQAGALDPGAWPIVAAWLIAMAVVYSALTGAAPFGEARAARLRCSVHVDPGRRLRGRRRLLSSTT